MIASRWICDRAASHPEGPALRGEGLTNPFSELKIRRTLLRQRAHISIDDTPDRGRPNLEVCASWSMRYGCCGRARQTWFQGCHLQRQGDIADIADIALPTRDLRWASVALEVIAMGIEERGIEDVSDPLICRFICRFQEDGADESLEVAALARRSARRHVIPVNPTTGMARTGPVHGSELPAIQFCVLYE